MGAYFSPGRGWRFRFWYLGQKYQSPRGFETKRDALDAETVLRKALIREAAGLEVSRPRLAPRFAEWAGVYMGYVDEQHRLGLIKRPDIIEGTLRVILRFWGARPEPPEDPPPPYATPYHDLRLDDPITDPSWLRKFEAWMQDRVKPSTRNHYLNTCARLYWLAQHPEYHHAAPGITQNPFAYRPRTRWQRRTATVTPVQLLAWIQAASYHARLALGIAALAPKLRLANILRLTWDEIDFTRRVIVVRDHKTDASGEPLVAPIVGQLRAILEDALARRSDHTKAPHVVLYRGQPIATIDEAVKRAALQAGLIWGRDVPGGVTFHTLRHSMATLLAKLGVHPLLHQAVMGHGDYQTTLGYTHLAVEDARPAAEALSAHVLVQQVVTSGPIRARRKRPSPGGC